MATSSPVFQFNSHHIRTTIIDAQPWFVAKDVSEALGLQWTGHVLSAIPDSWQGVVKLTTPSNGYRGGGNQRLRIISEPAVYKLAFRSNKPEADAFTNWVASEVLPAIRKTGKYEAKPRQTALPAAPAPLPDATDKYRAMREDMEMVVRILGPLVADMQVYGGMGGALSKREILKRVNRASDLALRDLCAALEHLREANRFALMLR